jgi:target of rapamycin complex 2 subunit MAPKAP1
MIYALRDYLYRDLIHHSPGSDEGSLLSTISGSQASAFPIQPRTSTVNGNNYSGALSPVAEPASPVDSPTTQTEEATYTEVTVQKPDPEKSNYTHPRLRADGPPVSNNRQSLRPRPPSLDLGTPRPGQQQAQGTPTNQNSLNFLRTSESDDMFAKKPIPLLPKKPPTSNLSRMLASQSGMTDNPFTELYGAISGRGDSSAISLDVYFPHSNQPLRAVNISIRKDATVEEVIGFGLWTYWEQKLEPKLDEDLGGDDDPQRAICLSAIGWSLRIAEDDGEVDEDFPCKFPAK